jgi:hypothetical protein
MPVTAAMQEVEIDASWSEAGPSKKHETLAEKQLKQKKKKKVGVMVQVITVPT